jgi:hypothetical protein
MATVFLPILLIVVCGLIIRLKAPDLHRFIVKYQNIIYFFILWPGLYSLASSIHGDSRRLGGLSFLALALAFMIFYSLFSGKGLRLRYIESCYMLMGTILSAFIIFKFL